MKHQDLLDFILERAAGALDPLPCHWIGGAGEVHGFQYDAGSNFCCECAEALIELFYEAHPELDPDAEDLYLDGGWSTEHDSPPFCEECGTRLAGSLTNYGVDQELEHFEDYAPGYDHVESWAQFYEALCETSEDDQRWSWVAEHVAKVKAEGVELAAREAALAAQPGMSEARTDLLTVLSARTAQQAHKPSFRLWSEMHEYVALSSEERRQKPSLHTLALGWRLIREADRFLANFGYSRGGWECFKTPYGDYWWPFVVEVEQYRLWKHPAFERGREDVSCGASRDDNRFAEETEDHRAWDAGAMSAGGAT